MGKNVFDSPPEVKKPAPAAVPPPAPKAEPKPQAVVQPITPAAKPVKEPEVCRETITQPSTAEAIPTLKEAVQVISAPQSLPLSEKDSYDIYLDRLEAQLAAKKRMINIALRQTNENDWILQGGEPYLEITGAEKIAPVFKVRIEDVRRESITETDEEGKKIIRIWYYATGRIIEGGVILYELPELFGSASTRDDFFAKNKDGSYKPLAEVDIRDIQYKAYSDLMRSAVVRLLGLRSVTKEELIAAGLNMEKLKGVDRGVQASPEEKTKQTELFETVKKLVGTDSAKVKAAIKEFSQFVSKDKNKDGSDIWVFKESADQLTGKWLDNSLKKAKDQLEKQNAAGGK